MTSVWAIADLHLSFGVPNKSMELFGPLWANHEKKIEEAWRALIKPEDLILIAGDISWAMHLEEVLVDLEWIHSLPGTKVMIKGNHDFWWASKAKMAKIAPPSIHFIYNDHFDWNEITIGGTRLWDSSEYSFQNYIQIQENPRAQNKQPAPDQVSDEKIFTRELERLKLSLKQLNPKAKYRIAMTHYPPISADLRPSATSAILEEFKIDYALFGHLHNLKKTQEPLFGTARGVAYFLTSCDYLNFIPQELKIEKLL